MKFFYWIIPVVICFGVFSCGEETPTSKQGADNGRSDVAQRDYKVYTVAEVKKAVWPKPGPEEIQAFDPVLTRDNYMAVLDMSGSMKESNCSGKYGSKAEAAREALAVWLNSVPRNANVGLVVFSSNRVQLKVPLGVDNRDRFIQAVQTTRPDGKTPLKDALAMAYNELERRARHQQGYGEYRIVVITDGMHSSGQNPGPVVEAILNNPANPVLIYTIGFCIDESALHQPGRTMYQSASNPDELSRGLSQVLAESSQFDTIQEFQNNAD